MSKLSMNQVSISVIIPVYNVELFLTQCLDSVIHQTLKEIEIICVNDGSTDNSLKILNDYASKDDRIIIINKENGGLGMARNDAIGKASGEYLCFVDSDDWIDLSMLYELYYAAKRYSSDVTMFEYRMYNAQTGEITHPGYLKLQVNKKFDDMPFHWTDIMESVFLINSESVNKIYKTEFVKKIEAKFPEKLYYEDVPFVFNCILKANTINIVRKPFYYYRYFRPGSKMADKGKKHFDIFEILQILEKEICQVNNFEKVKINFRKYEIYKYLSHYNNVSAGYKKEFWNRIKTEYNKPEISMNLALKYYFLVLFIKMWIYFKIKSISMIIFGKYAYKLTDSLGTLHAKFQKLFV